jgi:predicted DNA-binding transcriptional regulator YafY
MQRLDRLERVTDLLLVLLDTPRPLSLRDIANRVPGYPDSHAARRQAFERDKRLLRDEGVPVLVVPIDGEDQLGYRVDPDAYYLPDLGLEAEEQAALNLAVAGVHLGEPIGRQALLKLGAGGESPLRDAPVPLVDLSSLGGLPALPLLFDAIRQEAVVGFGYRGLARRVDAAGLRFRQGHWYLVGYDRDRGGPRTFRVDRMDGVPELGPPGSGHVPEDFDVDRAFDRDPWQFGDGEVIAVDVRVDGAEAGRVVSDLGAEAVVQRAEDGAVVVRLSVTDVGALVLWVLDLLDHAEVVRPPEVRQAVVERLLGSIGSATAAAAATATATTTAATATVTAAADSGPVGRDRSGR